jgi:hypothetical protein
VSLWNATTGEMSLLLPGFVEFRGIGNYTMVAVSFDRFRIAAVANVARASEDEPQRLGWPLYLMRVEYEGRAAQGTTVYQKPSETSAAIGQLSGNEPLRVVDAANYQYREGGEQDFWYKVETPRGAGWVFGSDLLIEGQDWRGRLELRGEPLDVCGVIRKADVDCKAE